MLSFISKQHHGLGGLQSAPTAEDCQGVRLGRSALPPTTAEEPRMPTTYPGTCWEEVDCPRDAREPWGDAGNGSAVSGSGERHGTPFAPQACREGGVAQFAPHHVAFGKRGIQLEIS
jgi:hypothetical protein